MKSILIAAFFAIGFQANSQTANSKYDEALAKKLGGDDYGMKRYVLVILKTGTNKVDKKEIADSLFRGHMENINRLADAGKLVVAGPLGKNERTYREIFIFDVRTIEEAQELLRTDPAVKEKVFDAELYQWYGSAALPEYLKYHEKIEKNKP